MRVNHYTRFMTAPSDAGFLAAEVGGAYGVGRDAVSRWKIPHISKVGKNFIYRKSDVIKLHGLPAKIEARRRRRKARMTTRAAPARAKSNGVHEATALDYLRVQKALREELECAIAPMLSLIDRQLQAMQEVVKLQRDQLKAWA